MFIVNQFWVAVLLCIITMFCWGSWANTQKLASRQLPFQLFYWDYGIGVLLLAIIAALTLGSIGQHGRSFLNDLSQAKAFYLCLAFIGGIVFNLANILLVAAIDVAGMAIAFPIAIGIALVLGVVINYIAEPLGNAGLLTLGVVFILIAIIITGYLYRRLNDSGQSVRVGIMIALFSGILMGFFYRFVAASMTQHDIMPESYKLTPYTAFVLFAIGLFISNFIFNTYMMKKPLMGSPVALSDYWKQSLSSHFIGLLGGGIWAIGTICSLLASNAAGFAISYGLGQGATMIAAAWGVFIWKEFANASHKTSWLVITVFVLYLAGLACLILARTILS